jgi:hypothetical protein
MIMIRSGLGPASTSVRTLARVLLLPTMSRVDDFYQTLKRLADEAPGANNENTASLGLDGGQQACIGHRYCPADRNVGSDGA